ncbi:hypothetical protein HOY80DRAFT_1038163 [Tuber brumale]|nr:hypothetical protein HOY80DRAFT_1038163 [Tuber brumale]
MQIRFVGMIKIVNNRGGKEKTLKKVIINKKARGEGEISSISAGVPRRMAAAVRAQALHPGLTRVDYRDDTP